MARVHRKLRSTVETVQKQLEISHQQAEVARGELLAAQREAKSARRQREAAVQLERQKKELMDIVSHDLRNPIAAVLLGVSTLQRKPNMPEALRREHLNVIHRAATRANRLIHDLLDAGRIEEGHLPITREPLHLRPVVDEAVQLLGPLAAEREVTCKSAAPDGLPQVHADRDRLLQVFGNLIGNAIRYSLPGGSITVSAHLEAGHIHCAVADDGPGIEPSEVPRVFDRYWQGSPREGHRKGGAGLGLAIAKGIVEAHGGRIWVETGRGTTGRGRGCRFVFTLPGA